MPGFADYQNYDATGLAELVRRGDVTPLELVEAAIVRKVMGKADCAVTYKAY